MITRSYCSSWTCSIILQSMQYLRRNAQDAGNPNIPWSCTTLLQNSQSAASGHISVPHTHASPVPELEVWKVPQSSLEGRRRGAATSRWGTKPNTLTEQKTQRVMIQSEKWDWRQQWKKNKIIPKQTGWVGKDKKLTNIENYPERPNEKAILDFHFKRFEVSGIHLCIPSSPPMWPRQTEIILKLKHSKEGTVILYI